MGNSVIAKADLFSVPNTPQSPGNNNQNPPINPLTPPTPPPLTPGHVLDNQNLSKTPYSPDAVLDNDQNLPSTPVTPDDVSDNDQKLSERPHLADPVLDNDQNSTPGDNQKLSPAPVSHHSPDVNGRPQPPLITPIEVGDSVKVSLLPALPQQDRKSRKRHQSFPLRPAKRYRFDPVPSPERLHQVIQGLPIDIEFDTSQKTRGTSRVTCNHSLYTFPRQFYLKSHDTEYMCTYVQSAEFNCGSYGTVLIFRTKVGGKVVLFAIKIHNDEAEYKCVQRLREVACGQVDAVCFQVGKQPFQIRTEIPERKPLQYRDVEGPVYITVMPRYETNLTNFISSRMLLAEDKRVAVYTSIAEKVYNSVGCLHNNGEFYYDVKPGNILLHGTETQNNASISVAIGDLGSNLISTVPCPFSRPDDILKWGVIILFADCMQMTWQKDLYSIFVDSKEKESHEYSQMTISRHMVALIWSTITRMTTNEFSQGLDQWFMGVADQLTVVQSWRRNFVAPRQ